MREALRRLWQRWTRGAGRRQAIPAPREQWWPPASSMLPQEPRWDAHQTRLDIPPFRVPPYVARDKGGSAEASAIVRGHYRRAEAAVAAALVRTAGWAA